MSLHKLLGWAHISFLKLKADLRFFSLRAALQDQYRITDDLQKENGLLKSRVAMLEARVATLEKRK